MSELSSMLSLAGLLVEGFQAQQSYRFMIVDPTTGEVDSPAIGNIHTIIGNLERIEEYAPMAALIKQAVGSRLTVSPGGIVSFPSDGQVYMFVPE